MAPLAAVVGIGSIAGIAALATEWGRVGFQVTNAANAIGISAGQLQSLRGAAGMAGISAGELDGALKSIGDTWQNAQFGRNQDALMMMNRLGISVHRLKDGSVDAARGLMDISRAIQGKNVEVQRLIANSLGAGSMLPLLQKGPAAIEAFQKKYELLAGVMSGSALNAASQFQEQMILLHGSIDGLKNRIGEKLIPILSPLIGQLTNWIAANKDLIATNVGEFVREVGDWLKTVDFKKVATDIKDCVGSVIDFVNKIGGWKVALIGLIVVMNGSLIASLLNLGITFVTIGGRLTALSATAIPAAVKAIGALDAAAVIGQGSMVGLTATIGGLIGKLGMLGLAWEAGSLLGEYVVNPLINKTVQAVSGDKDATLGTKIYDLTHPAGSLTASGKIKQLPLGIRSNNPLNMMPGGREAVYGSPEAGIGAAVANLRKNYAGLTLAGIVNKWSPPNAAGNSALKNANYLSGLSRETGVASDQMPDLNNAALVSRLVKAQIKQENGQQPYSDSQVSAGVEKGMQQEVHVKVTLANAPAGTTASAKNSAGSMMPVRVAYSMPTTVMP